jgi:hypothetical protein
LLVPDDYFRELLIDVNLCVEPVQDGNVRERNAGCDKSIFNRRCAGLAGAAMAATSRAAAPASKTVGPTSMRDAG